jgi:hypothetical protein
MVENHFENRAARLLTSKENLEQNEMMKKIQDSNKSLIDNHVEMTQKELEKSFKNIKLK